MFSAAPSSWGSVDGIQLRKSASVGAAAGYRASDHVLILVFKDGTKVLLEFYMVINTWFQSIYLAKNGNSTMTPLNILALALPPFMYYALSNL